MTRSAVAIVRIVAVMALAMFDANAAQPAEVVGVWINAKANTKVRIGPCGPALCGNIVWLKSLNDPQTGEPLTDRNNPDPANRSRPLLGMQIITDLKPGRDAGEWTGKVYSPNEGNTFDASLFMEGPNSIKMEGCKLAGLLCRNQIWTRVN